MKLDNRLTNIIAALFLIFVFFITVFSMKDDSLTMDELAHLPAGYSYLTQKDMRLNPEHPPLIKDLAAFPLLFIKGINFPKDIKAWKEDINGQWDFGKEFLFHSDNPAGKMIFWGRIPMILILILLGFYIFKWTKELFGNKTALLALFLFSFSPTFLAHGRLVTTDVGAAAGTLIATYYFIKSLQLPTKKNIILAGVAFGIAELCKFSLILLIPFFAILILFWSITKSADTKSFIHTFLLFTLRFLLILIIGFVLIWLVYQYHVWNYPPDRQVQDSKVFLLDYPNFIKNPIIFCSDKPILRPLAQYFTGVLMVLHRAAFGHTTYFLGEISNLGWRNYFPIVYSIKEPLTFHILTLIALLYSAYLIKKPFWQNSFQRFREWITSYFPQFAMLVFIGIYWTSSLTSNLNIGVRHLLPVLPFTFILASSVTVNWLKQPLLKLRYLLLGALVLWQAVSVTAVYPHFLAYFNELAGGSDKGYIYTVDSNLDWGQDLKRLNKWLDQKGIDKIYVDYFGGSDAEYYLKTKFIPWWGNRDKKELPKGSYLAVSATFLQGGRGTPIPELNQPSGIYNWLDAYKPVAKIGYSIFVYYID